MPRPIRAYRWPDRDAFRYGVLAECHRRFEALFGVGCAEAWLLGWRTVITSLVEQDSTARELRHDGSVERADAFLQAQGAHPRVPATGTLSPQTLELRGEVDDAIANGRSRLRRVGELDREIPKLTSSGLEAMILLFENHSDENGKSRWLTDRELAVLSLLLSPDRIGVDVAKPKNAMAPRTAKDRPATQAITTPPATAIEREARAIKRARAESGELKSRGDKLWGLGTAAARPRPLLKPVPQLRFGNDEQRGPETALPDPAV